MIYKIIFAIVVGVLGLIWSSIGCYGMKKQSEPLMCFAVVNVVIDSIIAFILMVSIWG